MDALRNTAFWMKIALLGVFLAFLWVARPPREPRTPPKADSRALGLVARIERDAIPRDALPVFPAARIANPGDTGRNTIPSYALRNPIPRDASPRDLLLSGRELARRGEWAQAEAAFEQAVAADPSYAEAWAYLGEARQHTQNRPDCQPDSGGAECADPALTALETALQLDPASLAAHLFLSLYWQRQNDLERALEAARAAAALSPETPAVLIRLGDLTALNGDLAAGQEYYLQAIAAAPDDPQPLREYIAFNIRYGFDLREAALPLARQLVIRNPSDPASLDVMGEVLLRLGDLSNAERFFRRALGEDPDYPQAHLHLGDLYRLRGEIIRAREHYRRALELSENEAVRIRARDALEALTP